MTSRRDNVDRDRLITSTCAVSAIDFRRSAMYGWSSTSRLMPEENSDKSASLGRYGLVALAFFHIAVGHGLHGTFGVFFVAMLDTFGWSRAATAGAISLAIIFEGACLPWAGGLIDRIGGRKTLMLGGLVLAVGLAFCSTISAIWQFYFWVGIVCAVGIALIGMVPHVAILTREFLQRRATALGIAWAGGGVGIVLLVPVTQLMIDNWSWPMAYIGLAAITLLLVIPPVQIFLPSGENPAGSKTADAKMQFSEHQPTDWTVKGALTNSAFWLLFTARTLASLGNQIIVTHQIAHAVDVGYAKVFAAAIFGLMGVISIGGRILFGYLADVMRREMVFTLVQIISAIGTLALLAMRDDSRVWYLRRLLWSAAGLASVGIIGDLSGHIPRQALRRDLRLFYLQHRPRRHRRRVARRVPVRCH